MAIFEMAFLMGRTVTELREDIPFRELQGWFNYFERRPAGWREDQRTAMLLQAQGVKKSAHELFPSLGSMRNNDPTRFAGSAVQHFLLGAKGGDKLDFLQ